MPLPPPPPPPPPGAPVAPPVYAPADDRRWGLGDAVASFGVFFGASLVVGMVGVAVAGEDVLESDWLPVLLGVPPAAQLAHVVWVARAKGRGLAADFGARFTTGDLGLGAILWIVALVAAGIVAALMAPVLSEDPSARVAELATDAEGGGGITVSLIALAVVAATLVPVVEELVYRGLWWSALEKRGVDARWTLVITSAVFAVVHFEPTRLPILFVLGLAIGYGRLRTGRVGASIVAHGLVNGLGMVALLVDLA